MEHFNPRLSQAIAFWSPAGEDEAARQACTIEARPIGEIARSIVERLADNARREATDRYDA